MKKFLAVAAVSLSFSIPAYAGAGVFAGLTYTFGQNAGVGFTVQATSSRKEDRGIVAAGLSFYPFSAKPTFGIPVSVGYQGTHAAGLVGYDILQRGFSVSGGYVNTYSTRPAAQPQIEVN
jgi:hypothetical protein